MVIRRGSPLRAGLLGTASALVLAASSTPSRAEQQLFNFFVNNLSSGSTGCCAQYQGPAYDSNHTPPGGFRTTSSGSGAISEVSSYGHGVNGGAVSTRLNDGYDGYGSVSLSSSATTRSGTSTIGPANFGGLTVTRNTQATHGAAPIGTIGPTTGITTAFTTAGVPNAVRFVDTITNSTGAPITGFFAYYNNLGSDANTQWVAVGPNNTYLTSIQSGVRSDPVLTHVFGNNAYTKNSVVLTYANGDDNPQWNFPVTVQPGQTIIVVTFDIVTGDVNPIADDPNSTADIALGAQEAQLIINDPSVFFVGLTPQELAEIINWNVAGTIDTSQPFFTEADPAAQASPATFDGGTLKPTTSYTFTQPFTITVNGGTVDNSNGNVTFSNVISGVGGLTLTGGNTTIFQAANTYQGQTTVNGGTLKIGPGGSIASSNLLNLAAAGTVFDISTGGNQTIQDLVGVAGSTVNVGANTLSLGTSNATFYDGSFSGSGGLIKQGSGALLLSGDSSGFTGTTTINSGMLAVGYEAAPNAKLGGIVNVESGATLMGLGTVGNINNIGGEVRPGASIGTLSVRGYYTQTSSGTLTIEVNPTTAAKLAVNGGASLNGTLRLVFDPGVYHANTYTLLSAASINGQFSTVTGTNPSGLAQQLVYGNQSVLLAIGPGGIGATNDTVYGANTTGAVLNAQQVDGMILDRIGQTDGGIANGQFGALSDALRPKQLAQAGGTGMVLGEAAEALPKAMSQGAWFRGIGSFASVSGNSSVPGFDGSTGGFLAGYDRPVAPNLSLGVAGGYLHSDIDEHANNASGTEESARVSVYGGLRDGRSLFSGTIGFAHDWFDSHRNIIGIGTATENHGGNEASAAAQWARAVTIPGYNGGTATLTPKAGISYLHLSEEAFTEGGASGFDLSNSGRGTDSLQPYIGAALAQKFVTAGGTAIAPEVRLSYAHDLFNSGNLTVTTVNGASFAVEGVKPSRDQLSAGIGVAVQAAPNLTAYADYDAIVPTGNTTEQTIQAGLRVKF